VATIYPAFDQPVVYAGQNVTGKVYVSVIQEEVSCVSVGCRIVGQELTAVTYTTSDSKGNRSSHTAIEKRRFMDMKICLHSRPEDVIQAAIMSSRLASLCPPPPQPPHTPETRSTVGISTTP
jgi:hypothetical protein